MRGTGAKREGPGALGPSPLQTTRSTTTSCQLSVRERTKRSAPDRKARRSLAERHLPARGPQLRAEHSSRPPAEFRKREPNLCEPAAAQARAASMALVTALPARVSPRSRLSLSRSPSDGPAQSRFANERPDVSARTLRVCSARADRTNVRPAKGRGQGQSAAQGRESSSSDLAASKPRPEGAGQAGDDGIAGSISRTSGRRRRKRGPEAVAADRPSRGGPCARHRGRKGGQAGELGNGRARVLDHRRVLELDSESRRDGIAGGRSAREEGKLRRSRARSYGTTTAVGVVDPARGRLGRLQAREVIASRRGESTGLRLGVEEG